jgi:hypothetical protein
MFEYDGHDNPEKLIMHIFLSSLALQPNKMFRDDFSVIFL